MNKGWNLYQKESMKHSVLQDLQRERKAQEEGSIHVVVAPQSLKMC